jgi:hypothetical protein
LTDVTQQLKTYRIDHQGERRPDDGSSASEKSINIYQAARHNLPEYSHSYIRRLENLKSYHVIKGLPFWKYCTLYSTHEARLCLVDTCHVGGRGDNSTHEQRITYVDVAAIKSFSTDLEMND